MGWHSLAIRQGLYGDENSDTAFARFFIGETLAQMGSDELAFEQLQRSLGVFERTRSPTHGSVASTHVGLARLYLRRNDIQAARKSAERVIELRKGFVTEGNILARGQFVLAQVLWRSPATRNRARELAREARQTFEKLGKGFQRETNEIAAWETRINQ